MSDASTAKAAADSFESAPPAKASCRLFILSVIFAALIFAAAVGLGVGLGLTANNPRVGFPARANIIMPFNMVWWWWWGARLVAK